MRPGGQRSHVPCGEPFFTTNSSITFWTDGFGVGGQFLQLDEHRQWRVTGVRADDHISIVDKHASNVGQFDA